MNRAKRAIALATVLLMLAVLMTLALAVLTSKVMQYRGAVLTAEAALAQSLAEAGLEDARIKLSKDLAFPPLEASPQAVFFSYSEEVTDFDGNRVGSYTVYIQELVAGAPDHTVRVVSVGTSGQPGLATVKRAVQAEFDEDRNLIMFREIQAEL